MKKLTKEQQELIKKNHFLIQELGRMQELYFETLSDELGLNKKGNDLLFDFLFNQPEDKESFEDYLQKLGRKLEGVVFTKFSIDDEVKVVYPSPVFYGRTGRIIDVEIRSGDVIYTMQEWNGTNHEFYEDQIESN
jgi:hypothetical protein